MRRPVLLTADAEADLADLHQFVRENDSPQRADDLLDQMQVTLERLGDLPDRGSVPRELKALGISQFRQVFLNPYRVIYGRTPGQVVVFLVADGRRDFQSLLMRRLVRP